MTLLRYLSLIIGKIVLILLRLVGKNGSALPGLIVEKLSPSFLDVYLSQLAHGAVVVTGTNGKTTTTKIISDLLAARGLRVLSNSTGSNFVRGVISLLVDKISLNGGLQYDIAILELDEAHAVKFVGRHKPRGVVALNVMRDQMDRFGEIDTTARLISNVAAKATDWLVLNANDPRIASISGDSKKVLWFGHSREMLDNFRADDLHYEQQSKTSKNRSGFFEAAKPEFCLTGFSQGQIKIRSDLGSDTIPVSIQGSHNAINIVAALTALSAIIPKADIRITIKALESVSPAFGRGEVITLKSGHLVHLQLVKNPAGFTHSLSLLRQQNFGRLYMVINDNHADGRDVSWLWDVDFMQSVTDQKMTVICGGSRAYDMAVRLKYDEIRSALITTDFRCLLENLTAEDAKSSKSIVFCTYTAMLTIRKLLAPYSVGVKGAIS